MTPLKDVSEASMDAHAPITRNHYSTFGRSIQGLNLGNSACGDTMATITRKARRPERASSPEWMRRAALPIPAAAGMRAAAKIGYDRLIALTDEQAHTIAYPLPGKLGDMTNVAGYQKGSGTASDGSQTSPDGARRLCSSSRSWSRRARMPDKDVTLRGRGAVNSAAS